ncbi:hypothetical protein H6503_02030 [Candidatus Woesearchaeota archaeon]|nr:hypothetical protein [Candidatus Woesearchaeota archaeon]
MRFINLILFFFVIALAGSAFAYDSGWNQLAPQNGGACGCAYPSCEESDYGLTWLQEGSCVTSASYDFLCQGNRCNILKSIGAGRTYDIPSTGNYYLSVDAIWSSEYERLYGGVNTWGSDSIRRSSYDFNSAVQCVWRNPFYVNSDPAQVWFEGASNSGSVHVGYFRLSTEIPDDVYVFCDDGSQVPHVYECNDGIDNDGDGYVDYPYDLGCSSSVDNDEGDGHVACYSDSNCGNTQISTSCNIAGDHVTTITNYDCINPGTEHSYCTSSQQTSTDDCDYICSNSLGCDYTECSDKIDNDVDSTIDFPNDAGCSDYYDDDESDGPVTCYSNSDCDYLDDIDSYCTGSLYKTETLDGVCNYAGTDASYCSQKVKNVVVDQCSYICSDSLGCDYTECSDRTDNDNDGTIDYPIDLGCSDYYDDDESDGYVACYNNADCGAITNDYSCNYAGDYVQTTTVPNCFNAGTEQSYCIDIIDTTTDDCANICSNSYGCDYTECSDGIDNDNDNFVDFPDDLGCSNYYDDDESNGPVECYSNGDCVVNNVVNTYCDGDDFVTEVPKGVCDNPGTEQSQCIIEYNVDVEKCNNICSNSLGCDYTECSDGIDNDNDNFVDYPIDSACNNYYDDDESGDIKLVETKWDIDILSSSDTYQTDRGCHDISVKVEAYDSFDDVEITVRIPGTPYGLVNTSDLFDIVNGQIVTKSMLLCLPDDMETDYYTLVVQGDDSDGSLFIQNYPIKLEGLPVECYTHSDCGLNGFTEYCSVQGNHVTESTMFYCHNAGTELSFCTNETNSNVDECDYICSNNLGCDYTECSDGIDNDNDNLVDYPNDLGCDNYYDDDESNDPIECYSNDDCPQTSQPAPYCDGNDYVVVEVDSVCVNPGTAQSSCEAISNEMIQECNYICSNNLGCDYTECSDGQDNDGDGLVDYPNDPGCLSYSDTDEYNIITVVHECSDGIDNDGDGSADYPYDFSCSSPTDDDETYPRPECYDGIDNDGDGYVDLVDAGCDSTQDNDERNVICFSNSDCGSSNDDSYCNINGDYVVDTTTPTCFNAGTYYSYCADIVYDNVEECTGSCTNANGCEYTECSDGIDNDNDGSIDYPNDLGCTSPEDDNEADGYVMCNSNSDCGSMNIGTSCVDGDFLTTTTIPTCLNPGTEQSSCYINMSDEWDYCSNSCSDDLGCDSTECSDGIDNDNDGYADYPNDLGCSNYYDNDESDGNVECNTDLDCGSISVGYSCDYNSFTTTTTTPVCIDAGTEHSSCTETVDVDAVGCNNVCSAEYGCDYTECSDGIDNDNDGLIDFGDDPGCDSYSDNDEYNAPVISCYSDSDCGYLDGTNTHCEELDFVIETNVGICVDAGTSDSYCTGEYYSTETIACTLTCNDAYGCMNAECSDGIDNDGDGNIDLSDAGCDNEFDDDESDEPVYVPQCSDGIDNDGDTLVDMDDPGCSSPDDDFEGDGTSACDDGIDNDNDGLIDSNDPGCLSPQDNDEYNAAIYSDAGDDEDLIIENMVLIDGGKVTGIESAVVEAGDEVTVGVTFRNRGDNRLDDVRLQVSIPELGISRRIHKYDLSVGERELAHVDLLIPDWVQPGEYLVRVLVYDEEAKRLQHRYLTIQ